MLPFACKRIIRNDATFSEYNSECQSINTGTIHMHEPMHCKAYKTSSMKYVSEFDLTSKNIYRINFENLCNLIF